MTPYRLLALFLREADVVAATQALQDAGLDVVEVYSPYPLHGLEIRRQLDRPSRIPAFCLAGGLIGAASGVLLPWWTNAVAWTLDFGGKPAIAWPAWVPIVFEMTVLFAAVSALGAFIMDLHVRGSIRAKGLLRRVSDDGFAIEVAVEDEGRAMLVRSIAGKFSAIDIRDGRGDVDGGPA